VLLLRQPAGVPDIAADAASGPETGKPQSDVQLPQLAAKRDVGLATVARKTARTFGGAFKAPADHLRPQRKAALLGIGAALLALFAVTLTLDFYNAPVEPPGEPIPVAGIASAADPTGDEQARAAEPYPDPLVRLGASLNPPAPSEGAAPAAPAIPAEPPAAAATPGPADAAPWDAEALMRNVLLPATASHDPWPQSGPPAGADPAATPLPPTIGSKALIAAAQAGDPGAAYEIAIRFTQSRNAGPGPDFARAAVWLERAAQAGLAPAQFRLGSMYDKGLGVRKDFAEARRLYLAAAAKGHAKAMHNLAVLYTRNIDGPADYGTAVEWFRKAAAYGTADSQYNLGILYARGAGIERDLVESYKWFTLAAKGGDKDAARKRDEVAKALDAGQLESAKASAEAFVAVPQPDEATTVRAPAGGWDQMAAAATTKSRMPARPERSPK
jgi:localization factor PodJL